MLCEAYRNKSALTEIVSAIFNIDNLYLAQGAISNLHPLLEFLLSPVYGLDPGLNRRERLSTALKDAHYVVSDAYSLGHLNEEGERVCRNLVFFFHREVSFQLFLSQILFKACEELEGLRGLCSARDEHVALAFEDSADQSEHDLSMVTQNGPKRRLVFFFE